MNRNRMTSCLKRAIAFALCSLCIFLYGQNASDSGSNDAQKTETHYCHHCGSVHGCEVGTMWYNEGWPKCELVENWFGKVTGCKVYGELCECS